MSEVSVDEHDQAALSYAIGTLVGMTRLTMQYDANRGVNFIFIVNFLVTYKIMSLEEASLLYWKFKRDEDVLFEIPEQLTAEFKKHLDSLNCVYE